jgi:hypothetical protein
MYWRVALEPLHGAQVLPPGLRFLTAVTRLDLRDNLLLEARPPSPPPRPPRPPVRPRGVRAPRAEQRQCPLSRHMCTRGARPLSRGHLPRTHTLP